MLTVFSSCLVEVNLFTALGGEADFDNSKINEWMNWNSRSVSVVWLFPDSSCSQNLTEKANDQLAGRRA
ncbi:hypothetical protein T4E_6174 [Trichinella pseudospiralis]|uniref:Uncharacterized protein n=1 Tax=Trichinella pseudospiralis TaxID=6337 RepID=A0A0V0XGV0_TRIPS|nr:hypothetical protein T4E_6174 [Trichinella pseudospiralis]